MSLLQDLMAMRQPVVENDEWEARHVASAEEHEMATSHEPPMDHETTTQEIASADEFTVEHDGDDMVHLLDGERNVRVSMPYAVWMELAMESTHRHQVRQHEGN